MKGTKKVVMSIMVLCLVLVGLLTPEKAYAKSDSHFVIENGVLKEYKGSGGDVVIPDGVKKIGHQAFKDCSSLTSVVIPDGVTEIGAFAFDCCTSLTSVTIPDSVTKIGHGAFACCTSLTSVTIPDSVTEIGAFAFDCCTSLTSVTIPDSVTEIGYHAFFDTPWLDEKRTERNDHLVIINNILIEVEKAQGEITIPDGVTKIGELVFNGFKALTSVTIPDSVTEIGDYAFAYCSSLTSVAIPGGVTEIGGWAFSDTPWLDEKRTERNDHLVIINNILIDGQKAQGEITIPDGVTEIGHDAFFNCSSLTSVTIPDSVTEIGEEAFVDCSKLKEFTIPKNVTKLGSSVLYACDSLEKITILNKKVSLIKTFPSYEYKNKDYLSTLLGDTDGLSGSGLSIKKPAKTITIYGYKYSTADEFVTRMNTLQVMGKGFGIKSIKFVPLDKNKNTLDKIKVPKSITITKSKSKKLSIQLPSSLKRVNKFTKKQGQIKISITYSKESFDASGLFTYVTKKVSKDTIKATKKGTGYAYTTVTLPNGDKKVFATKVIVK